MLRGAGGGGVGGGGISSKKINIDGREVMTEGEGEQRMGRGKKCEESRVLILRLPRRPERDRFNESG